MWYTPTQVRVQKKRHRFLPVFSLIGSENFMSLIYSRGNRSSDSSEMCYPQAELPAIQQFVSDPHNFIDYALDSILSILNAHAGSLFLWDESRKALVLKCARGPYTERIRDAHVKLNEGVSGFVGEQGRSVLVRDIQEDDRFNSLSRPGRYASYSFISVPLITNNKLIGVINITEKKDMSPFTEEELRQARTFAYYAATAYDALKYSGRVREENEKLSNLVGEMKQRIKNIEALATVGKLASNLAHELNNPLDSIRRYMNLALDQVPEDSLAREYMLKAKSGVRRAVRVVRGLLQFFRLSANDRIGVSEIHSLADLALDWASHDEDFQKITIEKKYFKGAGWFEDHGLDVVLRNLFKNAAQAMKGEGTLTVATAVQGTFLEVTVQDTGCGIPDKIRARLFEPFFTTKKDEGTGIGLTICKEIVDRMGGTIEVETEAGKGTRFSVLLPATKFTKAE